MSERHRCGKCGGHCGCGRPDSECLGCCIGDPDGPPCDGCEACKIEAVPDLLSECKRLTHIAKVIGDKQHAGNPISHNLWSELYIAETEARAAIAKATMNVWTKDEHGLSIGEHGKQVRGARHTLSHRIGEDDDNREYDVTHPLLYAHSYDVLWADNLPDRFAGYRDRGRMRARTMAPEFSTPFADTAVAIFNMGGERLLHVCMDQLRDASHSACEGYRMDVYDALRHDAPLPFPAITYNEDGPVYRTNHTASDIRDRQDHIASGGNPDDWIVLTSRDAYELEDGSSNEVSSSVLKALLVGATYHAPDQEDAENEAEELRDKVGRQGACVPA